MACSCNKSSNRTSTVAKRQVTNPRQSRNIVKTSKYNELSGKDILTTTPYGLLIDIILNCGYTIFYIDNNGNYSTDLTSWQTLNKGLYKRLKKYAESCVSIKLIKSEEDREQLLNKIMKGN